MIVNYTKLFFKYTTKFKKNLKLLYFRLNININLKRVMNIPN